MIHESQEGIEHLAKMLVKSRKRASVSEILSADYSRMLGEISSDVSRTARTACQVAEDAVKGLRADMTPETVIGVVEERELSPGEESALIFLNEIAHQDYQGSLETFSSLVSLGDMDEIRVFLDVLVDFSFKLG